MLAVALILESAYVLDLRRKLKLKPHFGVLWNRNLIPHCPSCSSLLTGYARYSTGGAFFDHAWGFKCVSCDKILNLSDDAGNELELSEARDLITAKLIQKPHFEYVVERQGQHILLILAKHGATTDQEFTDALGLHRERVSHILGEMEKNNYIYTNRQHAGPWYS